MPFLDGLSSKPKPKPQSSPPPSRSNNSSLKNGNGSLTFLYLLLTGAVIVLLISNLPKSSADKEKIETKSDENSIKKEELPSLIKETKPEPPPQSVKMTEPAVPSPVETKTPEFPAPVKKETDTIRILNGTNSKGLAAQIRGELEKAGFTVRAIGNARNQYKETIIYYDEGKEELAKKVSEALSSRKSVLKQSPIAKPDDVLVVAGEK